jgi:uncharacterized pyridoxal phosphate-containing UPF0001 family protein
MSLPRTIPLNKPYTTDITGYGELYEIESVRKIQRIYCEKKYNGISLSSLAFLLCVSNREHNGKHGMYLESLLKYIGNEYILIAHGFMDAPPWKSKPSNFHKHLGSIKTFCASTFFHLMVQFENPKPKNAHMIYAIVIPKKRVNK